MERRLRMLALDVYVGNVNHEVSDLPYNENRFKLKAVPDSRGYMVTFTCEDTLTGETYTFRNRWNPIRMKDGGNYVGAGIIPVFNDFIIERRAYK